MKFELERLSKGSSIEEIKAEIIRTANLIPEVYISKKKFDELSKISSSALIRKFGSWENTLNACNLGYRYSGRAVSKKMKSQSARNLTNEGVIDELKRVANLLNKKEISQAEFNMNSEISASLVAKRFGSWSEGVQAANLKVVKMGRRYSELDYFENLLKVWTYYGRQPFYREMDLPPSKITSGAYERKWGKWSSALSAFVDHVNGDKSSQKEIMEENFASIVQQKPNSKRNKRDIPLGLRYKILSRDRFRCVKCGNSPASNLNCKLHIDHIIPFSKGGKTIFSNLQTTCSNCNLGKGNRHNE